MIEPIIPRRSRPNIAQRITVCFDGLLSEIPPPLLAWSFLVYVDGVKVYAPSGLVPPDYEDNPVTAKFYALRAALQFLNEQNCFNDQIVFFSEDPMVINTMSRHWPAPDKPMFRVLWADCVKIAAPFSNIKYVWVTKMENREARALTIQELLRVAPAKRA